MCTGYFCPMVPTTLLLASLSTLNNALKFTAPQLVRFLITSFVIYFVLMLINQKKHIYYECSSVNTHTHTHAHTHMHSYTHTHTLSHTYTHACMCTRAHTYTHLHTHTHTHAHTHTDTLTHKKCLKNITTTQQYTNSSFPFIFNCTHANRTQSHGIHIYGYSIHRLAISL